VNLQLDHFPMIKTQNQNPCRKRLRFLTHNNPQTNAARVPSVSNCRCFEHGFHNVSRWMTWLPISLKNAAKCDKWYQLQNHSITESLNANGAREEPSTAIPVHAVSLSVEQKPKNQKESWLVEGEFVLHWRPSGYPESTVKPSIHG
tara:strand:+ start:4 stop:441 length:438 start_codon:yes stop_codon:yes gene_type:complete